MNIGVFGGSFDPPHRGHLRIAREFVSIASLDKAFIIPALIPPHKKGSRFFSPGERMRMCELTFSDPVFEISDIEIRREGKKSYTVDTLTALRESYPDDEFYLCIGSDMLMTFHTWYRYKTILSMCSIIAFMRDEEYDYDDMSDYADKYLSAYRDKIIISPMRPDELSSSDIREMIKNGEDIRDVVTPEVKYFIDSRGADRKK